MARYGASRHFVRQALFQLERQGIVLREKNIGATVRFYSSEEVRQIYEVREMLTRQAALMIALPAPAEPDRAADRTAAAILRQGRRAGSARHPRSQRRLSRRAVLRLRQSLSGALAAGLHEPDAADAGEESRRHRRAGAVTPPARIDDRAAEGPRQLGAGAALRRSHAVQQVGLSRPYRRGREQALALAPVHDPVSCRRRTPCCRTCRPGRNRRPDRGFSLACSAIACSRKSSPRPVGR